VEEASSMIEAVVFFLFLICVTLVFIRTAIAVSRWKKHRSRFSVELVAILTILYFLVRPAFDFLEWGDIVPEVQRAVVFLWAISVAFLVNSVLIRFFWDGLLSFHGERRVPKLITDVVGLAIYSVAVMFVLHYVYGEPIGPILATSGAAAVVIGFGAQSTIREVFSGFSLNATKALRIGDYVEIDDVYGRVYDINWRSVSLHNPHTDSLYIFPNSAVADTKILNFSEPKDVFRYYVTFSAELSAPPEKVIRTIADELKHSKYVFRDPKPNFNIFGYSERGIDYRVRYHFEGDDLWWDAQNEMVMAIWSAARRNDFRISMNRMLQRSPQEWPYLDEKVTAVTSAEAVVALIKANSILGILGDEEVDILCKSYRTFDLSPPSCFFLSGTVPEGLYVLVEGEVSILEDFRDSHDLEVDTIGPGQLFATEAILSGGVSSDSTRAEQYSIAVCFDAAAVAEVFEQRLDLRENLANLVEQNNARRNKRRDEETRRILIKEHHKAKRAWLEGVRRGVDDMMNKPVLHHILDRFSTKVQNEELAEGLAAAAALLSVARGAPTQEDKEHFEEALRHADLLRHLNQDTCLYRYDEYISILLEDGEAGEKRVLRNLCEAARVRNGADIVHNVAKGLCGLSELPTEEELATLKLIDESLSAVSTKRKQSQ
jgi:small-conductance mechanosensitive channel/CRP-like cAMP-binding protein/tellurite resistance protein